MSERLETMGRDALVDELYARLAAVAETEDPAPVLNPVVPGLARALAAHLTAHSGGWTDADVFALTVLVMVHSFRFQALPAGEDKEDERACLAWSRVLLPIAPEAVPDHVGLCLHEQDRIDAALDAMSRGLYHFTEYRQTGQFGHLQAAVDQFREAVVAMPDGDGGRPLALANLTSALLARFQGTGRLGDLDEAIAAVQEAIGTLPSESAYRPAMTSNLGAMCRVRFERAGQLADLEAAVRHGHDAVGAASQDDPGRPMYLSNLGAALQVRFRVAGQLPDLEEAITAGRAAVEASPTGDPDLLVRLSNLSAALLALFARTGRPETLDEAVAAARSAAEASPADHVERPMLLSNLGSALGSQFELTDRMDDLDEAIAHLREAAEATVAGHPDRPAYLSNLANKLNVRFHRTGRSQDLQDAVANIQAAVDLSPDGHPDRSMYLSNLALSLQDWFDLTGQSEFLKQALVAARDGARSATGLLDHRIGAAREWGRIAMRTNDAGEALGAYETAVELLPLVAWHGLDQPTLEHRLREWRGLASEAAAAAVAAGRPARAVELLEAGRGMLWSQALRLREPLDAVRKADPSLAVVLETARAVLARPAGPTAAQPAEKEMLEMRRRAAREWDAAVERVRRMDGFEHFLRPTPFSELRAAAAGGPVVIVNISGHGSRALVVTSHGADPGPGVQVVNLPAADLDTAQRRAAELLLAVLRRSEGGVAVAEAERTAAQETIFDVLEWVWDAIAEPVLEALGFGRAAGREEDLPRLWWCPVGPASVLPLHAAGRHPRTIAANDAVSEADAVRDSVAGRVVSSFTTTVTALASARARSVGGGPVGPVLQLAVGVADAPGQIHLDGVLDELQVIAEYVPPPEYATQLTGRAATRDAVLAELPKHPWLHLSCHGFQHATDASQSAFLLHDLPLTLADVAALDLPAADLAYLAACQTATGDFGLLDEVRHLAAALQVIGYRHVVATLWNVADSAAPDLADITYGHLAHADPRGPRPGDQLDSARAAYALYYATTLLRRDHPDDPLLWAPYIHFGP